MRLLLLALMVSVGTPASAENAANPAKAGGDKMICKRETPIGSLIASRKTCLTKQEWETRAQDNQAIARDLVQKNAGMCGGFCGGPN